MVRLVLLILYVLVTTICVGVATWSSFQGFRTLLDALALPVAIAIGVALFACDLAIANNRSRGQSFVPAMLFMLLPMSASVASNFNYFYTNAMKDRVASDQLVAAYERFDEIMQSENLALRSTGANASVQTLAAQVNETMRALRDQIADPLNPGLGPEARAHVAHIYQLLPNLTSLRFPDNPRDAAQVNAYVTNLQAIIDRELNDRQSSASVDPALRQVAAARERGRAFYDQARVFPLDVPMPKITAIGNMATLVRETQPTVENALREAHGPQLGKMEPIEVQDVLLGNIVYSFRNGFLVRPSPGTTIFALFASIGLDLLPLLFALALIRPRKPEGFGEL